MAPMISTLVAQLNNQVWLGFDSRISHDVHYNSNFYSGRLR